MYLPTIHKDRCKEHSECLRICPEDVFEMEGETVVVARAGDCTGCESCIVVCPEGAVTLSEI
jgi:NAD-dependent dihydropyrimidine dehydrogenase PreA subunit